MLRFLDVTKVVFFSIVALLTFSGASFAEGTVTANVSNGKNIFQNGKPDAGVPACSTCHGEKAMGMDAMGTPRLANVGYVYVVKQLNDFSADRRVAQGVGAAMTGFAKALSDQDKRDVASYVNSLPHNTEPSDLKGLKESGTTVGEAYKGQLLVRYGIEGKVSACSSCHGFNGRGADPVYPKISQQKFVYLSNQLHNWRDASRANDPMGQMRAVAKSLTDEDIVNIATYLSQASEHTVGDDLNVDNQTVLKKVMK